MEFFVKFVFSVIGYTGLIFYAAWGYAWAWNQVMPTLYGVGTVTMLQAWVFGFVVSVLTARASKSDDSLLLILSGYARVTFVLLVALILRTWFI